MHINSGNISVSFKKSSYLHSTHQVCDGISVTGWPTHPSWPTKRHTSHIRPWKTLKAHTRPHRLLLYNKASVQPKPAVMSDNTMLHIIKFTDKLFFLLHMAGSCSSVWQLLTTVLYSSWNVWRVLGWLRKHNRHNTEKGGEQVSTTERERELARLLLWPNWVNWVGLKWSRRQPRLKLTGFFTEMRANSYRWLSWLSPPQSNCNTSRSKADN